MYWFFQRKHTLLSVRSELNSICSIEYCSLHSGCTMAESVSRRPLTAETRVRSRVSPCDKVKQGQFFSEHFGFPLSVLFHQCCILISVYQKDKLANTMNFPKSSALLEIGELWAEK